MLVDDVRLTPLPSCNSRLTACFVSLRDALKTPQLMLTSSCSVYDPRSRLSVPPYSSFLLSILPDVFHEQSNNMRMINSKSFRSSFHSNALIILVYNVYFTYLSVSNSTSIQCNCHPFNIYWLGYKNSGCLQMIQWIHTQQQIKR